ncbi:MAG: alpha/beta hydrolase [Erysipelotrichia bacterium]|nr:alpha/beta hydrolase [Erysipelotrichia bacterium]
MKIIEYGKENSAVIMLLHGGGLSWWNYRDEANLLKDNYHVVLPVLDGHADSDTHFTTIEDNAKELISYIDENFDGKILAIGGLSLGGQVLVEMLSQRSNICRFAIIESALVIPMSLTASLIAPTFGISYGLIKKKWFSEMQFKSLRIQTELFEDYYRDTCKIQKQDMIRFLKSNSSYIAKPELANTKAKVTIIVGGKEQKIMQRSAEILHNTIPNSKLIIFNEYFHGELSLNYPNDYVNLLIHFL